MEVKEFITAYYNAVTKGDDLENYFHRNMVVDWHGTRGFLQMNANELVTMIKQVNRRFVSSRIEVTHLIAEGNQVSVRYNHYCITEDKPFEEVLLSTSISMWLLKNDKLYRGYVMGHSE